MAEGADRAQILQWFVKTLSDQLAQVFDTMAGESPLIEAETLAAPPADRDSLSWQIGLSVLPEAPIWIQSPRAGWHGLGNRVLIAAGLDDSDDQTMRDTFREALDQAFSGLAREITARLGREVSAASGKLTTQALPSSVSWHRLELIFSDNKGAPVAFGFCDELITLLMPRASKVPASGNPGSHSQSVAVRGRTGHNNQREENRTLDLLLDVELPISVSFGRAHLPLKEVMKLTTGSIVELNRTISEPVDIIVNNCVIARGEVVVVEGNFGVRISEVVSRQERLRTLY